MSKFKVVIYGVTFIGHMAEIKAQIENCPSWGEVIESLEEVRTQGSWYLYNQGAQHWDKVPDDRIPRFPN